MFLAGVLSQGGNDPESVRTEAKVQILKEGEGFAVKRIDLVTVGRVAGIDDAAFQEAAQVAKENCPISKALGAVPAINVDARLES
jgi:osmotically inducible protein OsmC